MIVSYETLRTLTTYLANCSIGLLLCDEGHRLKNSGMWSSLGQGVRIWRMCRIINFPGFKLIKCETTCNIIGYSDPGREIRPLLLSQSLTKLFIRMTCQSTSLYSTLQTRIILDRKVISVRTSRMLSFVAEMQTHQTLWRQNVRRS